jgi:hypothetical protein
MQDLLVNYLSTNNDIFHYSHDMNGANDAYGFNEIVDAINNADVFIGEMSQPSQTLGFQLAHALQAMKPVLYLYDVKDKTEPVGLIGNIPSRSLRIKRYDINNYKKIIDNFMKFSERQLNTSRTSFMSTKEIDIFLSSESKKQRISKGELIRQIIHRHITEA